MDGERKRERRERERERERDVVRFDVNNDIQGSLNKFPDFFHMGTFIDSTHMKL